MNPLLYDNPFSPGELVFLDLRIADNLGQVIFTDAKIGTESILESLRNDQRLFILRSRVS